MKSIQLKVSTAILLFFILIISVISLSHIFIQSIILQILLPAGTAIISFFILFIILKVLVLNKIYHLESEIDLVTDGDLDHIIKLNSNDEFERLGDRLNKLFKVLHQGKQKEKKELIDEITQLENEKYLENINDGLLFVDYGQIISDYYSRSLADIFDRKDIGGQHLSDFIYPEKQEQKERRKELEKFIMGLFNNPELFDEINEDNNPLHNIWVSRDDGKRILIDGSYRKIVDKGTLVQIMIIFKDRTDEGLLAKKVDEKDMRSNFELDSIVSILRAGPGPFLQFIDESDAILSSFRSNILEINNEDVINSSFRDINSMKGSAAYFDFKAVEKLCHNLEDILSDFRIGDFSRKEALDIIVDDLYIQFEHVKHLINRFQEFLTSEEGKIYETDKNEQEHFFDTLKIMMARNADYLEKEVDLSFHSDYDNFPLINQMKNPIIHLLRNSLDHGIELPEERVSLGKNERGQVSLSLNSTPEKGCKIIIEDDGRGIDFKSLREKAIEKGFIKKEEEPGNANLIRTLFKSGFSFKENISGLSGRGVGLDAVKEDVNKAGGRISIKTDHLKGTRFTILLPPDLF